MYLHYWGLIEPPFRNVVDPRLFYSSATHEEALARLQFLVGGRRRAGLLLGPSGSGKSLVLEVLARQLRSAGHPVARTSLLGLAKEELLLNLAACYGLDPPPRSGACELWRMLADRLAEFRLQNLDSVVLLDDCDEAGSEVLAQVARLTQTDVAREPAVTLVLAVRSGALARLGTRLLELADLRIDLFAWSAADTEQYLVDSLARAGRTRPAFAAEAVELLAALSGGIPRNVVQLADLALLAAAGQELELVDAHTVQSVHDELGVVEQYVTIG
ncbi:MAG: hypothetical protein HYX69_12170 [Planctomycetia bacterium]|nr:hypothetical protein [Planctomycetia bacterium]